MRAWVLHGQNDMRQEDIPTPIPEEGEVLVKVKTAGICSSDLPRIFEDGAYHYPIVLGHEFSGVTADGRRVGVFPLLPCHRCAFCKAGRYETCSGYSYVGSRRNGAFAEYVTVPEWNLIGLPEDVTFEEAAMFEPAAVALHAAKRICGRGIENVAVVGDGVIGKLIGAWLRRRGVRCADVLGRRDVPPSSGYDAAIEAAGSPEALARCIELVKPNGEVLLVGNPGADFTVDRMLYWQILRRQITLSGCWNSSYPDDWNAVLKEAKDMCLEDFISHRFRFSELKKAAGMMYHKSERHGKVMVIF